jgi:flagellar basal body rod protein FlgG
MLKVLRAAAAAMSAEQVRADLVAHNLANADTDGFHRLVVAVRPGQAEPLYRRDVAAAVGSVASGPEAPRVTVDLRAGVLLPTGYADTSCWPGWGARRVGSWSLLPSWSWRSGTG